MKWLAFAVGLVVLWMVAPAEAANPGDPAPGYSVGISPGEVAPTPEMWFYEQYLRRYQDPKAAVRQQAEFRAAQRRKRLAARRWFGFSNARPMAGTDPYYADYSPRWSSNNSGHPFLWNGAGATMVYLPPKSRTTY